MEEILKEIQIDLQSSNFAGALDVVKNKSQCQPPFCALIKPIENAISEKPELTDQIIEFTFKLVGYITDDDGKGFKEGFYKYDLLTNGIYETYPDFFYTSLAFIISEQSHIAEPKDLLSKIFNQMTDSQRYIALARMGERNKASKPILDWLGRTYRLQHAQQHADKDGFVRLSATLALSAEATSLFTRRSGGSSSTADAEVTSLFTPPSEGSSTAGAENPDNQAGVESNSPKH